MQLDVDDVNYLLDKAKSSEVTDVNEARVWLLVGKSLAAKNFQLNYEAYQLEKRRRNAEGAATAFEPLVMNFLKNVEEESTELANAVLAHHFAKGKETEEQTFLLKIFTCLPKGTQLEILMQKSETTPVLYEKCQCSLLLVKLYPDTVHQHGADLLFSVLSCESDAFSTFRKLLVVELVPAVLQLNANLGSSPKLLTLLNLCVEYYVLVADTNIPSTPTTPNSACAHRSDIILENVVTRMDTVFKIVDRMGQILQWRVTPFFSDALGNSSLSGVLTLCQNLQLVFQNQHKYNSIEIAYVAAISFLACLTTYSEVATLSKFGEVSKLQLVEVFCPKSTSVIHDFSQTQVLTTVSNDPCLGSNQTPLLNCFQAAVQIWQLIQVQGGNIETEFFAILTSMKSLNLQKWPVFQAFITDYGIYTGSALSAKQIDSQSYSSVRLASLYCSAGLYQKAAEQAIKIIQDVAHAADSSKKATAPTTDKNTSTPTTSASSNIQLSPVVISSAKGEDFSFFNAHIYSLDVHGNFITQRRVHFTSENRSELIYYAVNVLIRCFERVIGGEMVSLANEDHAYGHLMTLLQLEWPSPPTEFLFLDTFDKIHRKGSFSYYPFFEDFIMEPDFLEHFASMSYDDSCKVVLDFFGTSSISNKPASSRRMATRGVNKGTKDEFREAMVRQMAKNGLEKLEDVIAKFLTQQKADILKCFS